MISLMGHNPQRYLVCTEFSIGRLHLQQPVLQIGRFGTFMVKQELLVRVFTQDAELVSIRVVLDLNLFSPWDLKGFEFLVQFPVRIVPEDDTIFVIQRGSCLGIFNQN